MTAEILILGAGGQVGRALAAVLKKRAVALPRSEIDLLDPGFLKKLDSYADKHSFRAVINAAAATQVDKIEKDEKEQAMRINGEAVSELAQWCKARKLPLIHFSTDYVFDGSGDQPRTEKDKTGPINTYGVSKLKGEEAIIAAEGQYIIFRTSWVYDAAGKNFFNSIMRLLHEREFLNVVSDQIGAPTYAPDLARAVLEALERALKVKKFPNGIYHLCNGGETSWCGFAQAIFALARSRDSSIKCARINPIPTSDYPLPAKRPLNSRLDCSKAHATFGVVLPHWKEGLKDCFELWTSKTAKSKASKSSA